MRDSFRQGGPRRIMARCDSLIEFSGKGWERRTGASLTRWTRWFLYRGGSPLSMITLGLNYSQMHDSSACIARDGELLFAVAEERISRLKHDARFPQLAIQACLDFAKVSPSQIDEICFGWQTPGATLRHRPLGRQLSQRFEFLATIRQHGAPGWWRAAFCATFWPHQGALPFRRS